MPSASPTFPAADRFPSATQYPIRNAAFSLYETVGPPRIGLYPGVGQQPGWYYEAGSERPQVLYARIQFPSATIYPSRGLLPARVGTTPVARTASFEVRGRGTWRLVRFARSRAFLFSTALGGRFTMHGVFSSDWVDRLTHTVEFPSDSEQVVFGTAVRAVELEDGRETVEVR